MTLRAVTDLARFAAEWLYPAACRGCEGPLGASPTLCEACWESIPLWHGARCIQCGVPSDAPTPTCEHCPQRREENRSVRRIRAASRYEGALREALHSMKYNGRVGLAKRFVEMMLAVEPPLFDWNAYAAVLPIPLHRVRRAERGFNQAYAMARHLSRAVGLPMRRDWLRRRRATSDLAFVGGYAERRAELSEAFVGALRETARGRSLLLLDDIVTTGATTAEIARVLLSAGAGAVDVVCVARAGIDEDGTSDDALRSAMANV